MARYLRYAADTQNLLWAGDGLEKRPGYRLLTTLEGRINGIYFLRAHMVVHAGTRLYRVTADGTVTLLSYGLKDAPSKGVIRRQNAVKRTLVEAETCAWQRMTSHICALAEPTLPPPPSFMPPSPSPRWQSIPTARAAMWIPREPTASPFSVPKAFMRMSRGNTAGSS